MTAGDKKNLESRTILLSVPYARYGIFNLQAGIYIRD